MSPFRREDRIVPKTRDLRFLSITKGDGVVLRSTQGRILLVDDLALVRRTVPARLGSLGCSIGTVGTVAEAIEEMEKRPPDLILLDVVLPGMDGLTFCRGIKADPRYKDIPVVMFTDVAGNIFDRSMEAGADDYLPKRANDAYLRIRLHLHLHLQELRRRHAEAAIPKGPATILLATRSPLLQAQFASQFAAEGHKALVVDRLEGILPSMKASVKLLILDMAMDPEGMNEFLSQLRLDSDWAGLPVLLLCDKDEVEHLVGLEFMVDDVLVKPLAARVNQHRLQLLLEMGRLILGA